MIAVAPQTLRRTSDRMLARSAVQTWAVVAFFCVAAVVAARTASNLHVPGAPELPRYGMADFRDAIYYPTVALLDGRNPYDPVEYVRAYPVTSMFALYAPHTLLLHLPFALLGPQSAASAYFLVTLALVPLFALAMLRLAAVQPSVARVFGVAALLLLSRPGQSTLFLGQYTVTVCIGVCLALLCARSQPWLAAIGIAVSALKPTFGAPLIVLLLARGDWRPVLGGIGLASVLALVPTLAIGASMEGVWSWLNVLADNQRAFAARDVFATDTSVTRIDTASLVGRLAGGGVGTGVEPWLTVAMIAAAAVVVAHLAEGRGRARATAQSHRAKISVALTCVTVIVCVYHQGYDALLLAVPLLILLVAPTRDWIEWLLIALLAVPLINYASTFWLVQRLGLAGAAWTAVTSVNAAAIAVAWFLLMWAGVQLARAGAPR